MSQADDRTFRSDYVENKAMSIGTGVSVEFNMGDGTDTSTLKYLNLPESLAYGFEVMPTVACSISKINGRTLKSPISVGTGGFKTNHMRVFNLTITAGSATVVEVLAKGGGGY